MRRAVALTFQFFFRSVSSLCADASTANYTRPKLPHELIPDIDRQIRTYFPLLAAAEHIFYDVFGFRLLRDECVCAILIDCDYASASETHIPFANELRCDDLQSANGEALELEFSVLRTHQ